MGKKNRFNDKSHKRKRDDDSDEEDIDENMEIVPQASKQNVEVSTRFINI